tara:strand:+ start:262 stop:480 length:219 start_codon:yes stop_codon:yes gene_type:complete
MSGPFKMKGSPMKRNFGISPMKHGDGSGKAPPTDVQQKRLDIKSKYSTKHGSSSGGSDDEWNAYQAELKALD